MRPEDFGRIPTVLHDWIVQQLGDCAPKPCRGKNCQPVGYCNPANWFPAGETCTPAVWVTPREFTPVLDGKCSRGWRRRYTITFVVGCLPMPGTNGCAGDVTTTVEKVERCGLAFVCALDGLRVDHFGAGISDCGLVSTSNVTCLDAGDCAGWQADVTISLGIVSVAA